MPRTREFTAKPTTGPSREMYSNQDPERATERKGGGATDTPPAARPINHTPRLRDMKLAPASDR
jgi:hypothetical protein